MKRLVLLIVIYLAFISLGLPDGVLGLAWPAMRASLDQPLESLGLVTFVLASCSAVSGFVSGRVLSRFGTGRVTLASALMTALSLLGLSVVPNFPLMVALAFPLGLGAGAVDAGLNHYVAEHFASKHMNWLHACWGLGASLGPAIMGASLASSGGWPRGYLIIALGQMSLAAVLFLSLRLWSQQGPARHDPEKIIAGGRPNMPRWAPFLAALVFALYVAVEMGTGMWAASLLIESRHFAPDITGFALTLFYGSIMSGRVLVGFVSERLGNRLLIRLGFSVALVGVVLLLIPAWPYLSMLGLALLGFGCAPIYPAMMHETPRRFDPETTRRVIGWQVAAANLGGAILPAALGMQAAWIGLESIFITVAVLIGLLLALTYRLDLATA